MLLVGGGDVIELGGDGPYVVVTPEKNIAPGRGQGTVVSSLNQFSKRVHEARTQGNKLW